MCAVLKLWVSYLNFPEYPPAQQPVLEYLNSNTSANNNQ